MELNQNIRTVADRLLDLVYPRNCVGCRGVVSDLQSRYICADCRNHIFRVQSPYCNTCGCPFFGEVESERVCPHCAELDPVFQAGRTVLLYRGVGLALIQEWKYHKALYLLDDIRSLIEQMPGLRAYVESAILVPVPLHRRKLREREFNQSRILADLFGEAGGGLPVEELLQRVVDTESQTLLKLAARRRNVKNAFALSENALLRKDQTYILVDDVFTSGSTLNACSAVLRKAGARSIKALTLGHG